MRAPARRFCGRHTWLLSGRADLLPLRSVFKHLERLFLALLLSFALLPSTVNAVEIIAHRGASADAPENTLAAMKLAWAQQADAIELDLWLSADGKLIVFHDADTKRFEKNPRKITSLTLAEARTLDVGLWKGEAFKGEPVPTLESILSSMPKNKRAVLEIKDGPHIVPELVRVLRDSGRKPEEFVIISFNHASLAASKKAWPRSEHYFLHSYNKDAKTGEFPQLAPLIERAKTAGFDGLNLHFKWPITKEFKAQVKSAGLKLYVWTVNDEKLAKDLVEAGVDGITTDKPAWLRERLK